MAKAGMYDASSISMDPLKNLLTRLTARKRKPVSPPPATETLRAQAQIATDNGDYDLAERLCQELLKHSPDETPALRVLGHILLAKGKFAEALQFFSKHDRLTLDGHAVTRCYRQRWLDFNKTRHSIRHFRHLENVLVDTAYWTIMTDDGGMYSADTHGRSLASNPMINGRVSSDGKIVVATYPEPRLAIDTQCIFVGGDHNYSHWLFRNLLKLSTLDDAGLLYRFPWLLNIDLLPHQLEYLHLLGVDPARRIPVDRGQVIRCTSLIVPALLTTKETIQEGVTWIRKKLADKLLPSTQADQLLYLSRDDAPRRHIANEQELFQRLSKMGFRKLLVGRLSIEEQIREFSSARVIVAPHGASLTNMIFAPKDASIVEISSSNFAHVDDFRRIANAVGQRITTIVSSDYVDCGTVGRDADYAVDIDLVWKAAARYVG
jgi:capsular polysaccharide biosynthesis protein